MPSCFGFWLETASKSPKKTLDTVLCLYYNNKFLTKFLFDNSVGPVLYLP